MSLHPIPNKYNVLRCFSRLCEYMYRKGVKDSAELYSAEMSQQFLDENNPTSEYKFIFDEDGKALKLEFYCALNTMFLIKIRASAGKVLMDAQVAGKSIQTGAAALANVYYRKGVKDGIGVDVNLAKDYFYGDEKCNEHIKLNGQKLKMLEFIEDMRMEALRLDSTDFPPGFKIWKFICRGLTEYYASQQNY